LKVVDDLKDHPLKKMLNLGLKATVNSDDPAYFGGYMNANFLQTAEALDLTQEEIKTLVKIALNILCCLMTKNKNI
jgi:adenosine deaminase